MKRFEVSSGRFSCATPYIKSFNKQYSSLDISSNSLRALFKSPHLAYTSSSVFDSPLARATVLLSLHSIMNQQSRISTNNQIRSPTWPPIERAFSAPPVLLKSLPLPGEHSVLSCAKVAAWLLAEWMSKSREWRRRPCRCRWRGTAHHHHLFPWYIMLYRDYHHLHRLFQHVHHNFSPIFFFRFGITEPSPLSFRFSEREREMAISPLSSDSEKNRVNKTIVMAQLFLFQDQSLPLQTTAGLGLDSSRQPLIFNLQLVFHQNQFQFQHQF